MRYIPYILLVFVFASCQQSKETIIAKKWSAISVEDPKQDEMLKEQELFIDTFGKNNDAATNIKEYGFSNVDSARESLKAEYSDYKKMQEHAIENTWFDFNKNGLVIMNFSGQRDSANWYFDKEGKLILDEPKLKGKGNIIKMDIISITDTLLKLKFAENGGMSTVTFHPAK
jgi:hypothetical protein